jgi:hypothetical protein
MILSNLFRQTSSPSKTVFRWCYKKHAVIYIIALEWSEAGYSPARRTYEQLIPGPATFGIQPLLEFEVYLRLIRV